MPHAGRVLIQQLEAQGVTAIFTVPGESFLAALDGLHDASAIKPVICRQEGGASMMAEAWGKFTGRPGICFVTRGPGAANAMAGLHIAQQDSTPMILFLGLPPAAHEDRDAFQEIDTRGVFGTFVKWSTVIRDPGRIAEYVSRAFHVSQSGRPGPVVLGLPEDMLSSSLDHPVVNRPALPAAPAPSPQTVAALSEALAKAQRPLVVCGGPGWSEAVRDSLQVQLERLQLPVGCAFRQQDYIDNRHANYVGHVGIGIDLPLAEAVRDADLLIAIGARLGEMTTSGYTLVDSPNPQQILVHVHPDANELGMVYRADIPIASTAANFVAALASVEAKPSVARAAHIEALRAHYVKVLEPLPTPGAVQPADVIAHLDRVLPETAVVANGAGNYATFLHRYYRYKGYRTQLAPTCGSMGYGLPAAIAAKIAAPERTVVALAGDGCFMMTCQELATAVQHGAAVVTIVFNNGMYGTIRMHQEREYPSRVVATTLINPDFAAFARAFGGHGETVQATSEFAPALERALASGKPAIIELAIDPEAITPKRTLSQIRAE